MMEQIKGLDHTSIVKEYSYLVKRIAAHLISRLPASVMIEDLIQAGMIGLIEAHNNFDDTKGAKFSTYAGIRIRGAMIDEIRKGDWAPRSVHRKNREVIDAIKQIESETKRDAKDFEVAKKLNISIGEYHTILKDANSTKICGFSDIGIKEDYLSEGIIDNTQAPYEKIQSLDYKRLLSKAILTLPKRERLVLALYYNEDLNLKEVGEVMGLSESRISQLHSQAMLRLQARLSEE